MARRRKPNRSDRQLTDAECLWLVDPLAGRAPDGRESPFESEKAERVAREERADELVAWCRRNNWRIPRWLQRGIEETDGA